MLSGNLYFSEASQMVIQLELCLKSQSGLGKFEDTNVWRDWNPRKSVKMNAI